MQGFLDLLHISLVDPDGHTINALIIERLSPTKFSFAERRLTPISGSAHGAGGRPKASNGGCNRETGFRNPDRLQRSTKPFTLQLVNANSSPEALMGKLQYSDDDAVLWTKE